MTEHNEVPEHVARMLESVAAIQARSRDLSHEQRRIERLTTNIGKPATAYLVLAILVAWCGANLLLPALGRAPFDPPPFFWLQGGVSACALLTSIMILTTQRRQSKHAEQRAALDLQVNLLSEQKIGKLIALVEELRRDLPSVRDRVDAEANAMSAAVDPHVVLSSLEATMEPSSTPLPVDDAAARRRG